MKNTLFVIFFTFTNFLFGQTNRVVYKFGLYNGDINKISLSKEQKDSFGKQGTEFYEQIAKSFSENEFELIYNKSISIYRKIIKLDFQENELSKKFQMANSEIYFKDLINKEKIVHNQITRGLLNIQKTFDEYNWKITSDYKTINGYKVYKAICIKNDYYNPIKNTTAVFNITAWFTPDIPSSFGPQGYDGLPGLVLEASQNGKRYLYATLIEFDKKMDINLEKPKCDKTVTEKEFEVILSENFKKMQDEMRK